MFKMFKNKLRNLPDNSKIIVKNMAITITIHGSSLLVSFFTIPAYMDFFRSESSLGLWFTILAALNWILNFDIGIGNGLRNHLARTFAEKNDKESKKYISSAYLSIGVLSLAILFVFSVIFGFVNWNAVFNISDEIVTPNALLTTIKIVFAGIVLQFFLRLVSSVLFAMQKSAVNNFLSLCTSLIILFCIKQVIPSGSNDQNMVAMAVLNFIAVILPLFTANIIVFTTKKMRAIAPSFRSFSKRHAKSVMSLGGIFFFVQIAYMVIMNTNEYLITLFSSSDAVVDYQIYNKLFMLGSTLFAITLTPIWSAVTKAITERNFAWVKSLYKKMLWLAGLGAVLEFVLVAFSQIALNLWLGEKAITVNYIYGIAFAAMGSLMILNAVLSSIANGIGELKTQAIFFGLGAVLKIPLAWVLVQVTGSWIGIIIANIIAMSAYCAVQPFWLKRYINNAEIIQLPK